MIKIKQLLRRFRGTYKWRLLVWFAAIFVVFAAVLVVFQLNQDRNTKARGLQDKLSVYADMMSRGDEYESLVDVLPPELRATVIDSSGLVLFDSADSSVHKDNHFTRPEVRQALRGREGHSIRESKTMGVPYFYYAKLYGDRIIRVALPYDTEVRRVFRPSNMFLMLVFLLLFLALFTIVMLSDRFGEGMDATIASQNRKLKQQMTSNISHELRTPVTSIRGYLETLTACPDMDVERRRQFIERAYTQTLRLSDLIRDMALISRIEESPEKLAKEPVKVKAVVDDVFSEFAEKLTGQGVRVENHIPESLTVVANPSLLYSLFRNLVENSMKYGGPGILIHVEGAPVRGRECRFVYYDTGCGVPENHVDKIFERFHRVAEGRSRDDGGSGLGLSIVRNAVAFHGGRISARNRKGGGLVFVFTLC